MKTVLFLSFRFISWEGLIKCNWVVHHKLIKILIIIWIAMAIIKHIILSGKIVVYWLLLLLIFFIFFITNIKINLRLQSQWARLIIWVFQVLKISNELLLSSYHALLYVLLLFIFYKCSKVDINTFILVWFQNYLNIFSCKKCLHSA